jgi:adenosylcobinamide-GDP ribazoletransferase
MQPFLIALQFLTRLPLSFSVHWKPELVGRSLLYYPLVGLLIGVLLVLSASLFSHTQTMLVAAIILMLWVAITGGLHLDGLADSADAWAGGLGDKQRTLKIMQDPHAGSLAVVVLLLILLLKFSALYSVVEQENWLALIVAPVLARSVVILLFITTPYVREQGLGADMAKFLPEKTAHIILIIVALSVLLVAGFWQAMATLAVTLLVLYALRWLMMKRINGMTGDTVGASIEIIEVVVLLSLI